MKNLANDDLNLWMGRTLIECQKLGYRTTPVYKNGSTKKYKENQCYYGHKAYRNSKAIGVCLDDLILVDYDGNKVKDDMTIMTLDELANRLGLDAMPQPVQTNAEGDSLHFLFRRPNGYQREELKQSADGAFPYVDIKTGNQLMHLKPHKVLTNGVLPHFQDLPVASSELLSLLEKPQKAPLTPSKRPFDYHQNCILEAEEILSYINPEDRSTWINVLCGIKDKFPQREIYLPLADRWSSGALWEDGNVCSSYEGIEDIENALDSFTRTANESIIGWGTVCYMAASRGANLSAIAKKHDTESSDNPPVSAFTFTSADEAASKATAPNYLIKGVLEKGAHGVLAGETQTFKSFLALHMAHSVCTGTDFFGHKVFEDGPVVYICGEGHSGLSRRAKAFTLELNGFNDRLYILDQRAVINDDDDMSALASALSEINPVLVIFDTFSSLTSDVEENSNSDVSTTLNLITATCRASGAASMIVHHHGKDSSKGIRGASAFSANVDFSFRMTRDSSSMTATLVCLKMKDSEPFDAITLQAEIIDIEVQDQEGQPTTSILLSEITHTPIAELVGLTLPNIPKEERLALVALQTVFEEKVAQSSGTNSTSALPVVSQAEWKNEATKQKTANFSRARSSLLKKELVEHINKDGYRPITSKSEEV